MVPSFLRKKDKTKKKKNEKKTSNFGKGGFTPVLGNHVKGDI